MLINALLLVVGFILLIKGADFFVDGASSLARNFKIPKIIIGMTIIAFGTSAPELAVSLQSLASGSTDMVLGNVIGSNVINILLILGLAALIRPIKVKSNTIRKELPICLLISTLLAVLFLDVSLGGGEVNQISRSDGFAILLFFGVFIYYMISILKGRNRAADKVQEPPKYSKGRSSVLAVLGLAGVVVGSNLVVSSAVVIATGIGVSERLISLTIIALGTSLPELVTTIVAARKGEQDIALGNVIGSNIFNICIVLGVPVAIFGAITPESFQMIDIIMLVGSSILLAFFAITKRKITRVEGAMMLAIFIAYYTYISIA